VNVAVLDVCSGNLRSVERALEHVGAKVTVTRDADVVRKADKLVVPGQGAFGVFMRGLADRNLGDVLRERIAAGTPYLGICLGLQVLFEHSEEGDCAGLGILRGNVTRLRPTDPRLKIPHMGWNPVRAPVSSIGALGTPVPSVPRRVRGIADGAYVYFVHSYRVEPADPSVTALEADHGVTFCAAIQKDNLFACQFHPEKSQGVGLSLLRAFVENEL
jgi:glutamine amidotransferase